MCVCVCVCVCAGQALCGVLEAARPHLDSSLLNHSIDQLLHSLTLLHSSPPYHSQALLILLTQPHFKQGSALAHSDISRSSTSTKLLSLSCGGHSTHCPHKEPVSLAKLSDLAVRQLLEVTMKSGCAELAVPALNHICIRLGSASPADFSPTIWSTLDLGQCRESRSCSSFGGAGGHCDSSSDVDGEFQRAVEVVAAKASVKGLCPPFLLQAPECLSHSKSPDSWLPQELVHRLLESSVSDEASMAQCSLSGYLLLHLSNPTLAYFSDSCVAALCGRVVDCVVSETGDEDDCSALERALFLLSFYLTALLKSRERGRGI